MFKKINLSFLLSLLIICASTQVLTAQQQYSLQGKVINSSTRKPVDLAAVILLEAQVKTYTDNRGSFTAALSKPGTYTLLIQAEGLQPLKTTINISGNLSRDFFISPAKISGGGITITGDRDIQKISRHTMTVQELKEVPASFGDSLSALTALPNVTRMLGGMFGPLVVRGADPTVNSYLIDNIPIMNPMHFGGIHSIINNDLMREIDLYASSFPAQFGNAQGAVININTIDDVDKFGGALDLGLISASYLIKNPIITEEVSGDEVKKVNKGYTIISARIGYLPMTIRPIYEAVTGEDAGYLPYYGDYQLKTRYSFSDSNSLTFLAIGAFDSINAIMPDDEVGKSGDPLWVGAQYRENTMFHAQGLTHTYRSGDKFNVSSLLFASEQFTFLKQAIEKSPVPEFSKGFEIESKPFIFGYKNNTKLVLIPEKLELRGGAELQFYHFRTDGETVIPKKSGEFNPADKDYFEVVNLGKTYKNFTAGGFAETKLTLGGLTVVPGIRSEYLQLLKKAFADPRLMVSYTFPSDTTISAAGGQYSYFIQVCPELFIQAPYVAEVDYLDEQKSYHSSAAIEQRWSLWTFKTEVFYNSFKDIATPEEWIDNGVLKKFKNAPELKTYGMEFMLRLDKEENLPGFYGWVSYTFDKSRLKSNTPESDPDYYDKWIDSPFEMVHIGKLVAGYKTGGHTFGSRFQMNTSAPYTPYTGHTTTDSEGNTIPNPNAPDGIRYAPVEGERNSARYPLDYRLDLRYTYKTNYEWGHTSFYIEVINVTNKKTVYQDWDYRYPHSDSNPKVIKSKDAIAFIPNFGFEVKF